MTALITVLVLVAVMTATVARCRWLVRTDRERYFPDGLPEDEQR